MNINGEPDHLHALIQMSPVQSVAGIIKSVKGEAAWWANGNKLFGQHLVWSRGYYARSVDEANIGVVRDYILHQNTTTLEYQTDITNFLQYDWEKKNGK